MYLRTFSKTIEAVSDSFPVLWSLALGRWAKPPCSKCAIKGAHAQQRLYVTLNDMMARALAKSDPALFLQTCQPPLIIDEVQYASELFGAIKILVDRDKRKGMFWLTGSQKFQLMRNSIFSVESSFVPLRLESVSGRSAPIHDPFVQS